MSGKIILTNWVKCKVVCGHCELLIDHSMKGLTRRLLPHPRTGERSKSTALRRQELHGQSTTSGIRVHKWTFCADPNELRSFPFRKNDNDESLWGLTSSLRRRYLSLGALPWFRMRENGISVWTLYSGLLMAWKTWGLAFGSNIASKKHKLREVRHEFFVGRVLPSSFP